MPKFDASKYGRAADIEKRKKLGPVSGYGGSKIDNANAESERKKRQAAVDAARKKREEELEDDDGEDEE
jgi:hypothetical protein